VETPKKSILLIIVIVFFLPQFGLSQNSCNLNVKWCESDSSQNHNIPSQIKDSWTGWDKVGHLGFSAVLSSIFYQAYHQQFHNPHKPSVCFSAGFTFSLGIGKEIYDSTRPQNKFSYKDLVFDILGITAGIIIASQ
jgi:uncharacterized protein YfiM (DUF2279 family)